MENEQDFTGWATVEIMGHQRFAGHVSTQAVAGAAMLRIDIPAVDDTPAFTKLFGTSSIYGITPCTEEVARYRARSLRVKPIDEYEFPSEVRRAIAEFRNDSKRPLIAAAESEDDDHY